MRPKNNVGNENRKWALGVKKNNMTQFITHRGHYTAGNSNVRAGTDISVFARTHLLLPLLMLVQNHTLAAHRQVVRLLRLRLH
mmetsp:Transcript_22798/g.35074  ORF Transcript_22798/g.35074 Transcript_22798/m.35074 type:complete len:83 (-) Transcript_22798:1906-2154(-)